VTRHGYTYYAGRTRIAVASSVMDQLTSVWRQSRLSLDSGLSLCTKLRLYIYNALVVCVLHCMTQKPGPSPVFQYSDIYVICKDRHLHMKHSAPVQVTDLMTDQNGNVHEMEPDKV